MTGTLDIYNDHASNRKDTHLKIVKFENGMYYLFWIHHRQWHYGLACSVCFNVKQAYKGFINGLI